MRKSANALMFYGGDEKGDDMAHVHHYFGMLKGGHQAVPGEQQEHYSQRVLR